MKPATQIITILCLGGLCALAAGCSGVVEPVLPTPGTALTNVALTAGAPQPSPTVAPPTATATPTSPPATATGGATATSILGATQTPLPELETATPRPNPNAPRIELFTADPAYVYPGDRLTLFWSIRGADRAALYRLDNTGQRNRLWNVEPSGSLVVNTERADRGVAEFLLTVDNGRYYVEQLLQVPLLCASPWFFSPEPQDCPSGTAQESTHIEQVFEGGRMIYVEAEDRVYALFSDGRDPAWTSFPNRYVGGSTPDEDANFVPPPDRFQPIRILGVIWRASDIVRNRLGLGLAPETTYEGALQTVRENTGETIYLRSAHGSIIQLNPHGESWGIIAAP